MGSQEQTSRKFELFLVVASAFQIRFILTKADKSRFISGKGRIRRKMFSMTEPSTAECFRHLLKFSKRKCMRQGVERRKHGKLNF